MTASSPDPSSGKCVYAIITYTHVCVRKNTKPLLDISFKSLVSVESKVVIPLV